MDATFMSDKCVMCGYIASVHTSRDSFCPVGEKEYSKTQRFVKVGELLLKDVPVGAKIRILLKTVEWDATMVLIDASMCTLGWKKDEVHPTYAWGKNNFSGFPINYEYGYLSIKNTNLIRWYNSSDGGNVSVATTSHPNGMNCQNRYCNEWNSYGSPNTKDGLYLCWSCKSQPRCMLRTT